MGTELVTCMAIAAIRTDVVAEEHCWEGQWLNFAFMSSQSVTTHSSILRVNEVNNLNITWHFNNWRYIK